MKKNAKVLVLFMLFTLLTSLFTACNLPAKKTNSMTIHYDYMDQLLALQNFENLGVYKLLYDSLFYIDESGEVQPELV